MLPVRDIKQFFFSFFKKKGKYLRLSPASVWHPPLIALAHFPSCSLVLPSPVHGKSTLLHATPLLAPIPPFSVHRPPRAASRVTHSPTPPNGTALSCGSPFFKERCRHLSDIDHRTIPDSNLSIDSYNNVYLQVVLVATGSTSWAPTERAAQTTSCPHETIPVCLPLSPARHLLPRLFYSRHLFPPSPQPSIVS